MVVDLNNVTALAELLDEALNRISLLEAVRPPTNYDEPLDNIWMLICGYLVWFMSAGFCFLEMGSVHVKNSQNILAKNMIVPVLAFLCWYVTGYALAFGVTEEPNKFIGGTYFVLSGVGNNMVHLRKWFFQGAFCDTSASIVSGGVAERMTLCGFVSHTIVMTSFIYPVCVYWAWSGSGWLNYSEDGGVTYQSTVGPAYQDWAGSGVIHMVGGVAALCGAIVVGPRKGRFDENANEEDFQPHSIPFTVLGTFILWLGWMGFNPGCVAGMHTEMQAYTAANTLVNTTLAACVGGLMAWVLRRYALAPYHYDVPALCNGVLAGLVAVTAGSGFVKHWEAIIIGALAGVFYCLSVKLVARLKIDDPIDAISVHFTNGLWGALAIGFFGDPKEPFGGNGVLYGGDQLGVQVVACICFGLWSAVFSLLVFVPLRVLGFLRWSDEFQELGADAAQHTPPKPYSRDTKTSVNADTI